MGVRDFSIREAEGGDADALAELMRALHTHLREPTKHISPGALLTDVLVVDGAHTVLVAEKNRELIGYALFHETYESVYAQRGAYMADLYVAEKARRNGVARALVAAVAARAKARELRFVWWVSETWDEDAQGFYATLGASHDPFIAHAVSFDAFEALASEGEGGDEDKDTTK